MTGPRVGLVVWMMKDSDKLKEVPCVKKKGSVLHLLESLLSRTLDQGMPRPSRDYLSFPYYSLFLASAKPFNRC